MEYKSEWEQSAEKWDYQPEKVSLGVWSRAGVSD